jgi:hypothetical protein
MFSIWPFTPALSIVLRPILSPGRRKGADRVELVKHAGSVPGWSRLLARDGYLA